MLNTETCLLATKIDEKDNIWNFVNLLFSDGGTIPKRCELVRKKKKVEQVDKNVTNAAKWETCQLSNEPLRKPVIACRYGR